MKREIVLLQQAHVSFVVPHHLQGALHSTVRLHALPEGRRCDGTARSPGLGYVRARRGGGVSRAWARQGYRCRNMRGLILCCPTQARVATRSSAFPFRVYVTCHQSFHSLADASIIRWCRFRPQTAPCHRRAAFVAFWTYPRPLYSVSSSVRCLARTVKPLCIHSR